MVQEKNIIVAILLSFVTCGIYGIYWFITMTNDSATLVEDTEWSGGKAFLFTLITCGIYSYVWNYKMGKIMADAGAKRGVQIEDRSVIYLILSLCGLSIVSWAMIQSDINKFANS